MDADIQIESLFDHDNIMGVDIRIAFQRSPYNKGEMHQSSIILTLDTAESFRMDGLWGIWPYHQHDRNLSLPHSPTSSIHVY
jgi:hypothetical protein